ncbi:unnamed protein product [Lampetra planeri]
MRATHMTVTVMRAAAAAALGEWRSAHCEGAGGAGEGDAGAMSAASFRPWGHRLDPCARPTPREGAASRKLRSSLQPCGHSHPDSEFTFARPERCCHCSSFPRARATRARGAP